MNGIVKDFTVWMKEGFCGTYYKDDPDRSIQRSRSLLLADGTTLSIQASWGHYCSPKENSPSGSYDIYDSFEIGFPSNPIDEIINYAEDKERPTDTVYAYVPKQLIRDLISARGGVVGFKGED